MKIHEGAGLSAAFGGMHDRKETTNEHTDSLKRCVRLWFPPDRAARREPAPQPRAF